MAAAQLRAVRPAAAAGGPCPCASYRLALLTCWRAPPFLRRAFVLWPSLLLSLLVLLPLSWATTWLKRNARFDWPQFGAQPDCPPAARAPASARA